MSQSRHPQSATGHAHAVVSTAPRWQYVLLLWLLGLPGVMALQAWLAPAAGSWAVAALQGVLLALAVLAGVVLGRRVGLGTPLLSLLLQHRSPWRGIRYLSLPGLGGGIIGAAWMVTLLMLWPQHLSDVVPLYGLPLSVKLLYGGITEELLMRFGLMSLLMWLLWRLFGRADRRPGWVIGWVAVIASAALASLAPAYGYGWPTAGWHGQLVWSLWLCEAAYGVLAGLMFWRYGLEVAILAHAMAYLLSHGLV